MSHNEHDEHDHQDEQNTQHGQNRQNGESWYEEFKVQGDQLMAKVRELIEEGNVRRLFIKREDGETLFEIPLTAGVVVTAAGALLAPILVAVGAIAALVSRVTIGVERVQQDDGGADRADDPQDPE